MKFHDLPVKKLNVRVKGIDGPPLESFFDDVEASTRVLTVADSHLSGVFDITLEDAALSVRPIDESRVRELSQELGLGRGFLAEMAYPAADESVDLRIAFFRGPVMEFGDVDIGIDEVAEKSAERLNGRPVRNLPEWLAEECAIEFEGESFFLVLAGPAIENEISEFEDQSQEDNLDGRQPQNSINSEHDSGEPLLEPGTRPLTNNSFMILGRSIRFMVTLTPVRGAEPIYVISRLTFRTKEDEPAVRLARGNLIFGDWTRTGRPKVLAAAQLAELTADRSNYLTKWDEYLDLEGESFLAEIRAFGALAYSDVRSRKDGTVSVRVDEASDEAYEVLRTMGRNQELEYVEARPDYIVNPSMSFTEFTQSILRRDLAMETLGRREQSSHGRLPFEQWDPETRRLVLRAEALPSGGLLVLSTKGNTAQIKRRFMARRRLQNGATANPQLGLIISDGGLPNSLRSTQRIKPLSDFVRQKVFKNPPTRMQELAVEIALNTPDIALIQGPPGTGKTTVIEAILERLNELSNRDGISRSGQVLLTGFQQDAVENMIGRMSLNGLPVPKFGQRSGTGQSEKNAFENAFDGWCSDVARRLREKNPQITLHEEERQILELYDQYVAMPSNKLALVLMNGIAKMSPRIIEEGVASRASAMARRLGTRELLGAEENRIVEVLRGLRTRPESFADDGPERASDALDGLADLLDGDQAALLQNASIWDPDHGVPPFLSELSRLRKSLLVKLTAPPVFRVEKHVDEVLDVADAALANVRSKGMSSVDRKTAALSRFLSDLENNPRDMIDAVSTYSFAFAATVQQSVGGEVRGRKSSQTSSRRTPSSPEKDELLEYEYVIVDEAARVTPPDLMIALAQGKRIVLVGDHRQLPQIIEKKIETQMETGTVGDGELEWLRRSMFEYLFSERLKDLEEFDGIRRRVTLDAQFRMHPQLGEFISRNFYERHDRNEGFGSVLPSAMFAHHLPGTDNSPAIWIDVPSHRGEEKKIATSYVRQAEVETVVQRLAEWLVSPEGRNLTFGVISFYKAQADRIRDALRSHPDAANLHTERVRVGTVDSFQGMEFDVVFLSVVRTSHRRFRPESVNPQKDATGAFGHLCLSNRLNVSMSRQKRLLVAVGDAGLVAHPLAEEFIPGLVDFYRLASVKQSPEDAGNG